MATLLDAFFESEMIPLDSPDSAKSYDSCFQFVCRWLVINEYESPKEILPFPYSDRRQLHVIVKRAGGTIKLANSVCKVLGAQIPENLGDLERGDIGLLRAPHQIRNKKVWILAFGIKDIRNRWAMKSENGLQFLPLELIAGWHIKQVAANG